MIRRLTLKEYLQLPHVMMLTGDGHQALVDRPLAALGLKRRVALRIPLHSEVIHSMQGYPRKLERSRSMAGQSEIANAKKPVGKVSRCNAGAIKKAARRISLIYDKALAPTGLKITQYGILSAINARGAALPTMHELAEELVMDRSTLGQNLRPLERAELVAILTDPADRRNRLIALTKRGLTKLNEAAEYWRTAQDRFEEVFGEPEAAELRAVLSAVAYHPKFGERG